MKQSPSVITPEEQERIRIKNQDDAIARVMDIPEVKEWQKLFNAPNSTSPITGGAPAFRVDSETNEIYVVRVFENTKDRIITFGFYDVSKKSGIVKKEEN